jgi:hypothetical protein
MMEIIAATLKYILKNLPGFAGVGVALFVFFRQQRILNIQNRPIMVIKQAKIKKVAAASSANTDFDIEFKVSNHGKHPAFKLTFRMAILQNMDAGLEKFKMRENAYANEFVPGFDLLFTQHIEIVKRMEQAFYINVLMNYRDRFHPKKIYSSEYWFSKEGEGSFLFSITEKDKKLLEPLIVKALARPKQN